MTNFFTEKEIKQAKDEYDTFYPDTLSYVDREYEGKNVVGFVIGRCDEDGNAETGWDERYQK